MSGLKQTGTVGFPFHSPACTGVILAGCATGFNYSFDPAAGYTGRRVTTG